MRSCFPSLSLALVSPERETGDAACLVLLGPQHPGKTFLHFNAVFLESM